MRSVGRGIQTRANKTEFNDTFKKRTSGSIGFTLGGLYSIEFKLVNKSNKVTQNTNLICISEAGRHYEIITLL